MNCELKKVVLFLGSVRKSIPGVKVVHGVTVRKLPIGAFIDAVESIKELPGTLLRRLYPDYSADEALLMLKNIKADSMLELIAKAAAILPEELVLFCSQLLEVPAERIRDEMTPIELAEIISAFWEVNELSNFIMTLKGVIAKIR